MKRTLLSCLVAGIAMLGTAMVAPTASASDCYAPRRSHYYHPPRVVHYGHGYHHRPVYRAPRHYRYDCSPRDYHRPVYYRAPIRVQFSYGYGNCW